MKNSSPKKTRSTSLEGKRIRCHRCWAAGTFVRRTQRNWPPWYVEWVRPPLLPSSEPTVYLESQASPAAHSYCPACRTAAHDARPSYRESMLLLGVLGPLPRGEA